MNLLRLHAPSSPTQQQSITDPTESEWRFFPVIVFCFFFFCLLLSLFFSCGMETATQFAAIAHRYFRFFDYAVEFCGCMYGAGRRHHQHSVLARGQLPSPCGPPRHHRTKLEGRGLPVSQSQVCGPPLARSSLPAVANPSPPVAYQASSPNSH